jgi:hypothetical protein
MYISRTSGHYRLMDACLSHYDIPNSLCPYIRKLLFLILFLVFLTFAGIMMSIGIIAAPLSWFGIIEPTKESLLLVLCGMGTGVWVIASLVAFGVGGRFLARKLDQRRSPARRYAYKEPSVFVEWARAKKRKLCPYIEFKD